MSHFSRRDLLKTGLAAGALAGLGTLPLSTSALSGASDTVQKQAATDWVALGDSGVKVTRLAFGTGSFNGEVQRELGQDGFNHLVRHAYDNGIRFFETSDTYTDMHRMLGIALKGIPRENYRLMSKITTTDDVDPQAHFDELRKQIQSDYFDIMLLHYQHEATWPEDSKRWQDGILKAQAREIIRARGASVHGLPALRQVPSDQWVQVGMIRVNQKGTRMDAENYATNGLGNVPEVVDHIHQTLRSGKGVISMKLIGEGTFDRAERQAAMKFAFRHAKVDCVTVGYKSPAEVDEAIENINLAFV